jgi:hypothetical protein
MKFVTRIKNPIKHWLELVFFIIFSKNNMDEAPVGDAFILVILSCASHSSG